MLSSDAVLELTFVAPKPHPLSASAVAPKKDEFKPKSNSKSVMNAPKGGKAKEAKRAEAKAKKAEKNGTGGLTTKK